MLSRTRQLLALGTLAAAAFVALGVPASAHADLVSSEPAAGAPLPASRQVVLHFDDPVDPTSSQLSARVGGKIVPLDAELDGDVRSLRIHVPDGLAGTPSIDWSVVADDGHRTSGTLALAGATAAPGVRERPWTSGALSVARAVFIAGVLLLVGGVAFLAFAWPGGSSVVAARKFLWNAWTAAVAGAVAAFALSGVVTRRMALGDASRPSVAHAFLGTHAGHAWLARFLLLLLALPMLRALALQGPRAVRSPSWCVGAVVLGASLVRATGLATHASETTHAGLSSVMDAVHISGAAVWFGGLVLLAAVVLPRRDPAELAVVVPRFSTVASIAIACVVGAGAVLALQLVGGVHALFATAYGHLLLVKLALLIGVLVAARSSRAWVGRRLEVLAAGGDVAVLRPFVVSIAVEVALAAGVVAAASLLVATNPAH